MRRLMLLALASAALGATSASADDSCRIEGYGGDLGATHAGVCAGVRCYEGYCDVELDPYCHREARTAFDACDLVDGLRVS